MSILKRKRILSLDQVCPDCENKLFYHVGERGYFCSSENCKYSFDNLKSKCFCYFSEREELILYDRHTKKRSKTKKNQSEFSSIFLKKKSLMKAKILPSYNYQFEKREIPYNDIFYRSFVPFFSEDEVKKICGLYEFESEEKVKAIVKRQSAC